MNGLTIRQAGYRISDAIDNAKDSFMNAEVGVVIGLAIGAIVLWAIISCSNSKS